MRLLSLAVIAALILAGCADDAAPVTEEDDTLGNDKVEVDKNTGAIRGVVVDQTISPIEGAEVVAKGAGNEVSGISDVDGLFVFNKLDPGVYVVTVAKMLYQEVSTTVQVVADVKPELVTIKMDRLFDQDPYMETQKYEGFVGCAYNAGVSSTCVNDYTRICGNVDPSCCPGGCAPQITGVVDQREYQSSVGPGWQSIVWELTWESSLTGTAEEMGLTVSYATRQGASHWYTSTSQAQPFRLQCDVGIDCPEMSTNAANPEGRINATGQDDLWNMISAGDGNVALQQTIEVFQSNFYYAPAPEGWALLNGDEDPF